MAIRIGRSWNPVAAICVCLIIGVLHTAGWAVQAPERQPTTDSQRREAIDRLRRQMQRVQAPAAAVPEAPGQRSSSGAVSAPVPESARIRPASINGQKVTLNFDNLPLYDFVSQIASILGLTPIIVDSDIRGNVNLISAGPMPKEDVFPLFNMILKSKNAALIQQQGIYQVVPISSALKNGIGIIEQQPFPEDSKTPAAPGNEAATAQDLLAVPAAAGRPMEAGAPRLMTHVLRAEFIPVKDLIEPIKLFMTDGGVIMPYERLNMLILTDYSDSAEKVKQIIQMLDNSFLDPDLVELVKIDNNSSADVAEDLAKIFGTGGKENSAGISFISLDRLNTIFVMASTKRGLSEVKRWIHELDATSGKKFQTFVYVVQNSTASTISMMLSALFGGEEAAETDATMSRGDSASPGGAQEGGSRASRTGAFGASSSSRNTSQGSLADSLGFGSDQSYMGSGSYGTSQRLGPQLNTSRTVRSQILRGGAFSGLQDIVRLVVDDINNSLIIQSTPADYAYISETIKKMDVLPRQAIIDARIFEVDLTDDLSFGVNAELQARTDGNLTTAGLSSKGVLSANTFAFVGNSRQIMLALDALRTKTKVRILEAPSVLALDGTEARIIVGSEVPYPAGSFTTTSGSTTNVQYRDTGISLIVLPRISASGAVTLDITQEVSSIGAALEFGGGEMAPTFSKTNVMTTLSVKDGETVAIAGLIRDKNDISRGGVPLLSDIPILGSLFGATVRKNHRTELIILITPHVIRSVEKFQEMTQELKDSLRNVRKLADEKEEEHIQDMEDAREDRVLKQQRQIRKIKPAKKEKPVEVPKSE